MQHYKVIPFVGTWYQDHIQDCVFEVVAIDTRKGTVEIQYYDGNIDELEREEWNASSITQIAEPEDWTAPYDLEPDELETPQAILSNQSLPLAGFEGDPAD